VRSRSSFCSSGADLRCQTWTSTKSETIVAMKRMSPRYCFIESSMAKGQQLFDHVAWPNSSSSP
nr:hypothetical protein [Tanacetum cinerariifolium]